MPAAGNPGRREERILKAPRSPASIARHTGKGQRAAVPGQSPVAPEKNAAPTA